MAQVTQQRGAVILETIGQKERYAARRQDLNDLVQAVCTRCHNDQMLAGGHSLEGFTVDQAPSGWSRRRP